MIYLSQSTQDILLGMFTIFLIFFISNIFIKILKNFFSGIIRGHIKDKNFKKND
jgi:hypothetical protein